MALNKQKNNVKFQAGIFIIFSIALLFFSIIWLRYFAIFPVMTIIAKFKNPGPLSTGVQTYFKGICVGRIKILKYTKNFTYTLVYIDISTKNLKIPANSIAEIQIEGITGQKYIDIVPPYNPSSNILVQNSVIKGKSIFGITDFQYYLQEQVTSGRIERIFSNIEGTLDQSKRLAKNLEVITNVVVDQKHDLKSIFKNGSRTVENIADASEEIKKLSSKKQIWKDFEGSVSNINTTTKNLKEVSTDLKDEKIVQNIGSTIKQANSTMCGVNQLVDDLQKAGINKGKISSILNNTDKTASNFSCMSSGINKMLSERFLLLKLFFGRPGKHFENCEGNCQQGCQCPQKRN